MGKYVLLEHYNANGGKLGISSEVFSEIAAQCIRETKNVIRDKNNYVQVAIRNNTVYLKILVTVKMGINTENIKEEIEEKINNSLLLICETVPVDINIRVVSKELEA